MQTTFEYDISVIVLCYNPEINQLKKTLDSIINQMNVKVEIIISDDGSKNKYGSFVNDYFTENDKVVYKFITSNENTGTVKNVIRGLNACSSDYVKLISPGDYLANNRTLSRWLEHIKNSNAAWSFGKAIYYHNELESDEIAIDRVKSSPCILKPYKTNNADQYRYNYIVNWDYCLGAATLCRRNIMEEYLSLIDNRVIYAEDTIYLLMMGNREVCSFFDAPVVYYEYSNGISNKVEEKWGRLLRKDYISAYEILLDTFGLEEPIRKEVKKIQNNIEINNWLLRNIRNVFVKGRICFWIERALSPNYSYVPAHK